MSLEKSRRRTAVLHAVQAVYPEPLLASVQDIAASLGVPAWELVPTLNALQGEGLLRSCRSGPHARCAHECCEGPDAFTNTAEERFFCLTAAGRRQATETGGRAIPKTVLVVDDDQAVLRVIARMLADRYEVLVAGSGAEALRIARHHRVDLLLTDVMMPGIDGWELAVAFQAEHASAPVLYMSGYSESVAVASGFAPGVRLLQKPFRADDLFTAISQVLARATA